MDKLVKPLKLIGFILVIITLNLILNYLYGPPTEYHRIQNHELKVKEYDLIAFGPSDCKTQFSPEVANEKLDLRCFNYGQAGTTYKRGSVMASFENALSYQKPKVALFFVSCDSLYSETENDEAVKIYLHSTEEMGNKLALLKYYYKSSIKDGALEKIFKWKTYLEGIKPWDYSYIAENIQNKNSDGYKKYKPSWRNNHNTNGIYVEDGFVPYRADDDYTDVYVTHYEVHLGEQDKSYVGDEDVPNGYDLDEMISVCKKKGIKPYIIMGPLRLDAFVSEGHLYEEKSNVARSVAEANDTTFFEMNYIKKELYRASENDWHDDKHLNYEGAKKYTGVLCELIKSSENGESIEDLFYKDYEECLGSYENVKIIKD